MQSARQPPARAMRDDNDTKPIRKRLHRASWGSLPQAHVHRSNLSKIALPGTQAVVDIERHIAARSINSEN